MDVYLTFLMILRLGPCAPTLDFINEFAYKYRLASLVHSISPYRLSEHINLNYCTDIRLASVRCDDRSALVWRPLPDPLGVCMWFYPHQSHIAHPSWFDCVTDSNMDELGFMTLSNGVRKRVIRIGMQICVLCKFWIINKNITSVFLLKI